MTDPERIAQNNNTLHILDRVMRRPLVRSGMAAGVLMLATAPVASADRPHSGGGSPIGGYDSQPFEPEQQPLAPHRQCGREDLGQHCEWKVRGEPENLAPTRRKWRWCVSFDRSRFKQEITCSITKSEGKTSTAQVGGTLKIDPVELSATVGYSVEKTSAITGSDTFTIPPNSGSGTVQFAELYRNRKKVTQENVPCYRDGESGAPVQRCYPQENPRPQDIRTVTTEQFAGPIMRSRVRKAR